MSDKVYLSHGDRNICINIIYSKRKTIGLEVKKDLTVNLRAPFYASEKDLKRFIDSKKDWLIEAYEKTLSLNAQQPEKRPEEIYYDGALLPFRGNAAIKLNIIKAGESDKAEVSYNAKESSISIITLSESSEFIRECVTGVYRKLARREIEIKAAYYAAKMGVTYNRIFIKEQKTVWGSCSGRKNLNFNWKLIMMPESILDYVVVHELSHLIEMNHSPSFWAQVEKVIPDYKERTEWLRGNEKVYTKF